MPIEHFEDFEGYVKLITDKIMLMKILVFLATYWPKVFHRISLSGKNNLTADNISIRTIPGLVTGLYFKTETK